MVSGVNKLDALTRILEAEPYDGMLIFSRTKLGTQELAEKLAARGLSAAAIHGDVEQKQREKMVQSLKDGRIDILVATDVARSEEHTSELQSLMRISYAVFCLKKKNIRRRE